MDFIENDNEKIELYKQYYEQYISYKRIFEEDDKKKK